jgi:hypothetical protein
MGAVLELLKPIAALSAIISKRGCGVQGSTDTDLQNKNGDLSRNAMPAT